MRALGATKVEFEGSCVEFAEPAAPSTEQLALAFNSRGTRAERESEQENDADRLALASTDEMFDA